MTDTTYTLPEPEVSYVNGVDQWGYDDYDHAFSATQIIEAFVAGRASRDVEVEALRADAGRYRWIRPALTRGGAVEDSDELVTAFSHLKHTPTESEFDRAIDAAIAAKEE